MIDEIYNYHQSSLLTAEHLTIFYKLCDLQSDSAADNMRVAYKAGFKNGATAMIKVMV